MIQHVNRMDSRSVLLGFAPFQRATYSALPSLKSPKVYMCKSIVGIFILLVLSVGCAGPVSGIGNIDLLQIEVSASSSCVKHGEIVNISATATNGDSKTRTIQLHDKPMLDIQMRYSVLNGETSRQVEQVWSDGRPLTPELTQIELKPGESKTIEMDWIAQPPSSSRGAVDVTGLLRYGERVDQVAAAHLFFFVDAYP